MRNFLLNLLYLGFLISGGASTEDRKSLKCKNPSGKLWSSIFDKNCGQSVCQKIGKKASWRQCPKAATEAKIEEVIKKENEILKEVIENQAKVLNEKIEKVTKMQEVMENQLIEIKENLIQNCGEEPVEMTTSEEGPIEMTTTAGSSGLGVLITGGGGSFSTYESAQLFVPATGRLCHLEDLPDSRYRHTLNNLVVCGSAVSGVTNSCVQFVSTFPYGSWREYGTTEVEKYDATGFAYEGKVLLLGGGRLDIEAEIVGEGVQFQTNKISAACGITDGASIVVTGGYYSQKTVERYNLEGFLETLPDLLESRFYHGCGVYTDQANIKTYVVAGGAYKPQATTEVLKVGGDKWSYAASLPRGLYGPAFASLENSILFIGGKDGNSPRAEILEFNGNVWQQVGIMEEPRYGAAAQAYDFARFKGLNLTNCI